MGGVSIEHNGIPAQSKRTPPKMISRLASCFAVNPEWLMTQKIQLNGFSFSADGNGLTIEADGMKQIAKSYSRKIHQLQH